MLGSGYLYYYMERLEKPGRLKVNLCSSLKVTDQVSQSYNRTGNIHLLVICINIKFLRKQAERYNFLK